MRVKLMMCLSLLLTLTVYGQSNSLQLGDLVNAALEHNQSLKNEELEIEKSEIVYKQIYHTYIPTLEASGTFAHTSGTFNMDTDPYGIATEAFNLPIPTEYGQLLAPLFGGVVPTHLPVSAKEFEIPAQEHSIDFNGNIWMAGLTAKWTIFTGLKVPLLAKAMEHKILAQEYMKSQSEAEVISQVTYYYDKIALLKQSEILLNENKTRLEKETKVAQRALEEGLITHHQFQKIEIATLELQSKLVEYNGSQMVLYLKLKQLTGIPTVDLEKMDVELTPLLTSEVGGNYMNRAEIKALDEAILASEYKAKSELSGYLPKVQAFASHSYAGTGNGELGDFSYNSLDASPMNMVGIGFKWELFDGLHTHAERQKALIEVDMQENKKVEVMELLELNYENSVSQYNTALAKVELKEKQKSVVEDNMGISLKELENGLIQMTDFLEAHTEYEESILDYYKVIYEQRQCAVNMMKATGMLKANSLQ